MKVLKAIWGLVLRGIGLPAGNKEELVDAAGKGDISTVNALLAKGAEVNAKSNVGVTALMMASLLGHLEVVQALLAKGADVNAKGDDGWTAFRLIYEIHPTSIQILALIHSKRDFSQGDLNKLRSVK